jgi:hypothetical protein
VHWRRYCYYYWMENTEIWFLPSEAREMAD